MSESAEQKSEMVAAAEGETASLPLVEAPAISPTTVMDAAPVEMAPTENPPSEIAAPAPTVAAEPWPSATQRFRAAAAAQISAARERLAQRNAPSVAALMLMAGFAGAFGTALATSGLSYFAAPDHRASHARALDDSIARIEDEIAALRGNVERTATLNATQANKTVERLERIEKAQAEPAAKLAKLTETVERLRAANAAASAASASAGDITGSVKPAPTPAPAHAGKPQPAKPAIVEGWVLREIDRDAALIEGKRGLFETYVGDTIPGVGRVEGFRKQDGRWVVVTAKGVIVSR